jgi:hypothetical protein
VIVTRVAALGFPEHRFRGYAVFAELVGHESTSSLIALAVTGRRLNADEAGVLDDIAATTLVGDPRIWPLKLIRIVASYGGVLAGYAAGHMAIEGDRIGPPITRYAADMLVELRNAVGDRIDDRTAIAQEARRMLAGKKRLIGYGIPFRPYDERYVVLQERMKARGRADLPYFRVHDVLSEVVREQKRLAPNAGIAIAAILLDMGFSPEETATVFHFINQPVFIANAYEAATRASAELRSLPAETIAYSGSAPRLSPRAGRGTADDDSAGGVLHRR